MSRGIEDRSAERMLERYRRGLLTRQELDDFLDLERRRAEIRERALQEGREPGRASEEGT